MALEVERKMVSGLRNSASENAESASIALSAMGSACTGEWSAGIQKLPRSFLNPGTRPRNRRPPGMLNGVHYVELNIMHAA